MTLAVVFSRASLGIHAPLVTVETHISHGLPGFTIVGLPETAVKESKDRVRSAMINSRLTFPTRRITVNLAPADLPKEGGRFDLPIALGILAASGQIPLQDLKGYEFAGELALSGDLHPIYGTLPLALAARTTGRTLVVPQENAEEAALPGDNTVIAADSLLAIYKHLSRQTRLNPYRARKPLAQHTQTFEGDFSDIRGQMHAKRALEIAAAGGHSLLMMGPPGTGKTLLASRLPSIMPPLSLDQLLEVVTIHSLLPQTPAWVSSMGKRPFRAPHHTASAVALVGGGSHPRPGEISLAHHGILFLDELPEFDRHVLEVLREPLESGTILISRAARQAQFPAQFQLIAAMNPCPCGYLGDPRNRCQCKSEQITRYRARLSGPLLDRIDIHLEVPALPLATLTAQQTQVEESSASILERILPAVSTQRERSGTLNARLNNTQRQIACFLDPKTQAFLNAATEKLGMSARSYHRALAVARTIADLELSRDIQLEHIQEALSYRAIRHLAYH
jgi:magnesium chelatase family protein